MVIPKLLTIGKHSNHNVYVSLGFHVNMYHSYRIDTNDEAGFGKDIRVIRKIIEVLDEKNKKGIPVKGVWDFENLFTLEEILPEYAPDIIANIKRRVKEHGDEIILMSYNNGLVSAMTQENFCIQSNMPFPIQKKWRQRYIQGLLAFCSPSGDDGYIREF
jgi:hypothetical protein